MREVVDVAGSENEASAQLHGVFSQLVLAISSGLGAFSGLEVGSPKKMQKRRFFELERAIGFSLFVHQQWKGYSCLFTKGSRILKAAQAHGGQVNAFFPESRLVFAQLRDMLAAEDSTIVAEKHHRRGTLRP